MSSTSYEGWKANGSAKKSITVKIIGVNGDTFREVKSPMQAIRAKCLDCSGGSADNVRHCPITDCPLFMFRMDKNPLRKPRSAEQRAQAAERMRKLHERKQDTVSI